VAKRAGADSRFPALPATANQKAPFMKYANLSRLSLILFVVALVGLSSMGCRHTANGAGQDMEEMGQKIQDKTQ
jgi:predicted small secreted protein